MTCALVARRDAGEAPLWDSILRTAYWDVAHNYHTALPGWLVLVARRHIEAIDELTADEAHELGVLLRRVSLALKAVTGCAKTYVIQFAEAADHPHVHFHVVPRMPDLPESHRGPNIFNYMRIAEDERVSDATMNAIATAIREQLSAL